MCAQRMLLAHHNETGARMPNQAYIDCSTCEEMFEVARGVDPAYILLHMHMALASKAEQSEALQSRARMAS